METVRSKDGTRIAYARSGTGPALLLVHGTAGDHTRWMPLLPKLEPHFTVYAMDRRGRGGSGDAETYEIQREFEDIAAVVDAIAHATGEPVNLLGHSYGALCSLEAARLTKHIDRLILYEPPLPSDESLFPAQIMAKIDRQIDEGDPDAAVVTFMREVVGIPDAEIDALRALPSWAGRVIAAHTIPREERATVTHPPFNPARFKEVSPPTLLLLGGDSPPFFGDFTRQIHVALPNSQIAVMPGQQHTAMNTAPELFLSAVFDFLGITEAA
jgi:pimeloyl-ACP methyl ester carboxylesterase